MKFRPKFMATALSAMPHKNVEEACQVMLHYFPEAPSVPHSLRVLPRNIEGLPCLKIDGERKAVSFDFSSGREREFAEFYEKYLPQDLDYFAISPELEPQLYKLAQMLKGKPSPKLKFIHFGFQGPYNFWLHG